jgi:hypothetical protein
MDYLLKVENGTKINQLYKMKYMDNITVKLQ